MTHDSGTITGIIFLLAIGELPLKTDRSAKKSELRQTGGQNTHETQATVKPLIMQPSATPSTQPSSYENEVYTNYSNKFSMTIPGSLELDECTDTTCAIFGDYNLRFDVMDMYGKSNEALTDRIKRTDLMCSAGGPMGSVECVNTKVSEFKSNSGVQGYKVERRIDGTESNGVIDHAYVFVTDEEGSAVVLQSPEHRQKDLQILDTTAKSLKFL